MKVARASGSFAELLVRARTEAGLSQEDLAKLVRVSRVTIREAELGRDPRRSTIARILAALPAIRPSDVVGGLDRVPPALDGAWLLQREVQGAVARLVRLRVRVGGDGTVTRVLDVSGVRSLRGDLAAPSTIEDLVRMVLRGPGALVARLGPLEQLATRPASVVADDVEHVFSLVARGRGAGLRYRRTQVSRDVSGAALDAESSDAALCLALGTCVTVEHPIERLELELSLPASRAPREPSLLAWPGPLVPERGTRDIASRLHPGASCVARKTASGNLVVRVDRPQQGVTHSIGWASAPPHRRTASNVLRAAREREGLSARALGGRMRASAMTVVEAERGRDPRRSTLCRFAEALPDLSPWELFPPASSSWDADLLWLYQREIFGCEVDDECKSVTLDDAGDAAIAIATSGLRRRRGEGDFHVRLGYSPPVVQPTRARLREVKPGKEDSSEEIRIAPIAGGEGEKLNALVIPPRLAGTGVSFVRKLQHAGVFTLTADRARARTGQDGPFHEGTSFGAALPTRRLRIVVRFPNGAWPEDAEAHAWPVWRAPDPALAELAPRFLRGGLGVDAKAARRTLALTIERPLVGVKYALGWRLR